MTQINDGLTQSETNPDNLDIKKTLELIEASKLIPGLMDEISPNLVKYCRKFSQKPGFFFGKFTQKYQKRLFFSQNFDIFLQNPVSGPLKRHDGG